MPTGKQNRESDDTIAHSVRAGRGITQDRQEQERRVGSGNLRRGQAQSMRAAGATSSSKTGATQARSNKRASSR
jgi:hypothetical protein